MMLTSDGVLSKVEGCQVSGLFDSGIYSFDYLQVICHF